MKTKVFRIWGHDVLTGETFDSVHVAADVKQAIAKHESTAFVLGKTQDTIWWAIDHIECQD